MTMRIVSKIIAALLLLYVLAQATIFITLSSPSTPSQSSSQSSSSSNSCSTFRDLKQVVLANADRKIRERHAWLTSRHVAAIKFAALTSDQFFYMFTPVLPCLWTFEKEPPANVRRDGPKWLCGLQQVHQSRSKPNVDYKAFNTETHGFQKIHYDNSRSNGGDAVPPCIVYSMGSNQHFDFESRIRTIAPGCEIHTFDPTSKESGVGKEFYDQYHGDYGFGGVDSVSGTSSGAGRFPIKSLGTIMKELNHNHVDYLKIDVEGYEWDFLSQIEWNGTSSSNTTPKPKVGQILIELHPRKHWPDAHGGREMTALDMHAIFNKLERAGYRLISLEPVTYTSFGQVELVFLHKDWDPSGNW